MKVGDTAQCCNICLESPGTWVRSIVPWEEQVKLIVNVNIDFSILQQHQQRHIALSYFNGPIRKSRNDRCPTKLDSLMKRPPNICDIIKLH